MPDRIRVRVPLAAALVALPLVLGGCLPAAVIPGAVMGAAGLYCATVSETGKTMARNALTGGAPLIACPDSAEPVQAEPQGPR
ncbi:hypothetical protein [Roseospira navarrensis]|uniref:Lipoprotein n=1 Tax=Roseospira navarrensis TaxID=140058 RepID=A0A7X1ZGX0_9PROT|nr:hypothetical protein [Roseospira navarrensis]MQX38291.1 hypothetical protein [Roseospira navarrensis]